MSARAAPLAFDDRLNPILVKEVRQALRGRYFRALFWLTLGVATLLGLSIVANASAGASDVSLGRAFFLAMYGCLSAAVHAFTPFSAFLSTSAERDENTHDLLVLSSLRPRQIVLGKLLSALVQALLYYSTFGPFLVFAFLTNGVDLRAVGVMLVTSLAACTALTLLAIALAALAPAKAARVVLMALFGVGLMITWGMSMSFASFVLARPQELRDPMALPALAAFVCGALLLGGLFAALAVARLSHEEENRASGLRVLSVVTLALATLFAAWMKLGFSEPDFAWGLQLAVLAPLALLWLGCLTESERLGRHVALHVPRSSPAALLVAAFLPGGGRGVLLMALHTALALAGVTLVLTLPPIDTGELRKATVGIATVYAYAWIYMALPAGAASFLAPSPRLRALLRLVIICLGPLAIVGPPLVRLVLGIGRFRDLLHPFNPAWALSELMDGRKLDSSIVTLVWIGAAVAAAVNLPRVGRSIAEVLAASRARARR